MSLDKFQIQNHLNQAAQQQAQVQAAMGQICGNVATTLFVQKLQEYYGDRLFSDEFRQTKEDFEQLKMIAKQAHTYGLNFGPFLAQAIGLPVNISMIDNEEKEDAENRSEPQDENSNILRP